LSRAWRFQALVMEKDFKLVEDVLSEYLQSGGLFHYFNLIFYFISIF